MRSVVAQRRHIIGNVCRGVSHVVLLLRFCALCWGVECSGCSVVLVLEGPIRSAPVQAHSPAKELALHHIAPKKKS